MKLFFKQKGKYIKYICMVLHLIILFIRENILSTTFFTSVCERNENGADVTTGFIVYILFPQTGFSFQLTLYRLP